MRLPVALRSREISSEILLGCESVVRRTIQRQIVESRRSTVREGFVMVKLEPRYLATALAALVDIRTTIPIAFEHRAAHGGRQVPVAHARSFRIARLRRF
jgi:hypothetical protein